MVHDKYPGNSRVYSCWYEQDIFIKIFYKVPISLNWSLTLLVVTFEVSRVPPLPWCGLPKQVPTMEDLSVFIRF